MATGASKNVFLLDQCAAKHYHEYWDDGGGPLDFCFDVGFTPRCGSMVFSY